MILITSALVILLTAGLSLRQVRMQHGKAYVLELTPSTTLICAFTLYALALPISRVLFTSHEAPVDTSYLLLHVQAAIGLLVGFGCASAVGLFDERRPALTDRAEFRVVPAVTCMLFFQGIFLYTVLKQAGFSPSVFLARYGAFDRSYDDATVLNTGLILAATASTWIAVLACAQSRRSLQAGIRWLTYGAAGTFAAQFILRGNRNAFLILVLPLIGVALRRQRLKVKVLVCCVLVGWLTFYSIGIVRNWGFGQVEVSRFSLTGFDPLSGEFGTMYSVYQKYDSLLLDYPLQYGSTYVWAPLVNLVPREVWQERPFTIAQEASVVYRGTGALTDGIGFSPVVEVLLNFGPYIVLPAFCIIAFTLAVAERVSRYRNSSGVWWMVLIPMAVNFCRIDFATVTKMYLLHLAVAVAISTIVSRRTRNAAHHSAARTHANVNIPLQATAS